MLIKEYADRYFVFIKRAYCCGVVQDQAGSIVYTDIDITCPEQRNLLAMAPCTAASRSAFSNTMKGALPPSSIEAFFTVDAACSNSIFKYQQK